MDGFSELLREEPAPSEEERQVIVGAWEHLFARATRGPFGMEDARTTLGDYDPEWADPDATMLARLFEESSDRLMALSEPANGAASPSTLAEALRAAREVQFATAQLFASSQLSRLA